MKQSRPINAGPVKTELNKEAIDSVRIPDGTKPEHKKSNPNLNLSPEKVKSITDVDSSFWGIKHEAPQQNPNAHLDSVAPLMGCQK